MPKAFAKHKAEDKDMETTEAISAFFFLAALSKYGADVILESVDDPKDKKKLAREFVSFYDKKVKGFMDLETKLRMKPQKFHESVFAVYNEFKQEFPELFDDLRERLWTSQGELMASYGSPRFAHSWIDQHYMGRL
jgi:hypothetical protein